MGTVSKPTRDNGWQDFATTADSPELRARPRGTGAPPIADAPKTPDAPATPRTEPDSLLDRVLAPVVAAGSIVRRARLFHPSGTLVRGTAVSIGDTLAARAIGARLAGPVVMRFSGGFWKHREWTDVLGVALRFTRAPLTAAARAGDQDLLMITASSIWSLPLAALATQQHDYLANAYHGAALFELDGIGPVELRLVPRGVPAGVSEGDDRGARLLDDVRRGSVTLQLEFRRQWRHTWCPLVEVRLDEACDLDQDELEFQPGRDARGVHPRGWVHGLRRRTYAWSQAARRRTR
jgi:hypothetical protein